MLRRSFLVAATAATTVPVTIAVAQSPSQSIKVLDTYLTNAELFPNKAWPRTGTNLVLRRDPDRTFDPTSIQVLDEAYSPLGYLPPVSAQVLGVLMDHGTATAATALTGGRLSVSIVYI